MHYFYFFVFFFQLDIPINEFEVKRWFKCVFVNMKLKEEVSYFHALNIKYLNVAVCSES